jgi:ribokinase
MVESNGRVTVVGSCNFDQVVYVPKLPIPGQTVHGTKYVTGFGGKGANQVIVNLYQNLALLPLLA